MVHILLSYLIRICINHISNIIISLLAHKPELYNQQDQLVLLLYFVRYVIIKVPTHFNKYSVGITAV